MRSFAFGASLAISRMNRSALFEHEKYTGLASVRNSTDLNNFELRNKLMDLTSNWTQKIDFHDGVRVLTIYEAQWSYAAAAAIISIVSVFSLATLFWS